MSHTRLALALAMTVAIAPFALDAYLPAFPQLAASLGVSVHEVALSVSVYIGALSLGQLVGGPLADHHGRQPVMFLGLIVFIATSFIISRVDSLAHLLMLRGLQAFGGGWVLVCVPALVRDRVSGVEAARLFSLIGLIMVAAPALAPSIGSVLLEWGGWRSIFLFLALYGLLIMLVLQRVVFTREYREATRAKRAALKASAPARMNVLQRYLRVIQTPTAARFILLQGAVFSVMMLFVTHASFIYQEHFAVSTGAFALLFGANVVSMGAIMFANRWLVGHFSPGAILRGAVTLQGLGVAGLILTTQFLPVLWLYVPSLMITIGAIGAITPNAQACYMEHFAENGGTAAALMGAMQFGLAGVVSALSTALPETIQWIALAQAFCSLAALALVWWPMLRRLSDRAEAAS